MSLVTRAGTFAQALAAHIAAGCPGVTAEQFEARLQVCMSCEFYDFGRVKCLKCGCSLRLKASWADSSCPLDPPKWTAIEAGGSDLE